MARTFAVEGRPEAEAEIALLALAIEPSRKRHPVDQAGCDLLKWNRGGVVQAS